MDGEELQGRASGVIAAEPSWEALDDTGERMVPEKSGDDCFWEHIYRYRFASRFVPNRRVLDIACGEGYGAAALAAAGAASLVGVDICEQTCIHARRKYGIDARPGKAEEIPLPSHAVDVVVSFETIEHVERPKLFLDECLRVLAPGGLLIVSTPNRDVYNEEGDANPYHFSEMSAAEFVSLLEPRFSAWQLYTQRPKIVAWWNLRSLAGEVSPWQPLRGFSKLTGFLRASLCPHVNGPVDEKHRRSPVGLILTKDRPLSALVNPYAVRPAAPGSRERPRYLLAVARV